MLDGTMHHSPFRRRWTGGTAAVNGMEERDRVDASTNFCSRPVAATGRRYLRPRPVDANRLCYFIFFTRPVAATGQRQLRPRPVDFGYFCFLTRPWLLLDGDTSVLARLILLFHFTQPVAVTGRRRLRHRPVDANRFCYFISSLDRGCQWPETTPSSPG